MYEIEETEGPHGEVITPSRVYRTWKWLLDAGFGIVFALMLLWDEHQNEITALARKEEQWYVEEEIKLLQDGLMDFQRMPCKNNS